MNTLVNITLGAAIALTTLWIADVCLDLHHAELQAQQCAIASEGTDAAICQCYAAHDLSCPL